jgi:hypothetical protein
VAGAPGGAERRASSRAVGPALAAPGFGTELEGRHRYRLMKRLGRGRFGSVFLARRLDESAAADPESVAVKVFPCRRRETHALRRELAALLAIRDPHVPRLHDWSTEGRYAFVAMEYFASGSLADRIVRGARPDEDEVWALVEGLLAALAVAHQASVLHLDVKPSNVLVGDDGRFALSDFGISEAARSEGVAPRGLGTPGYCAPEQSRAVRAAVDARTDLFGVGATAWAFATGLDLSRQRRRSGAPGGGGGRLPALEQLRPDLSPSLVWLVAELLRADPEARPGSASEALARLRSVTGLAEPPPAVHGDAGETLSEGEVTALVAELVDPLTAHLLGDPALRSHVVRLAPGEILCGEGEPSDCAFLLLRGALLVERPGRRPARVAREGDLLGEVSALTGRPRVESIQADGAAWVCVLNAARFERLVASCPSLALRLMRSMAERYA